MIEELQAIAKAEYQKLPPRETLRLIRQAQRGGEPGKAALDQLIRANVRLILKEAKRYAFLETVGHTYTYDDIFSCAIVGFMRGVQLFQPKRRVQLSTYLIVCMRRHIVRAFQIEGQTLRLPIHVQRHIAAIKKAAAHISSLPREVGEGQGGGQPTAAELARATGLSEANIHNALSMPSLAFSLDEPANGDDPSPLGELIPAPSDTSPEFTHARAELLAYLQQTLSPRLYHIFALYHGLDQHHPDGLTMPAIAKRFGITRQAIDIHLKRANALLRAARHAARLRQLLNASD